MSKKALDLFLQRSVAPPYSPEEAKLEFESKLLPSENALSEFSDRSWPMTWSRTPELTSLFHITPSFPTTVLNFQATGLDGRITGYYETSQTAIPQTAANSTSLQRKPGNFVSSGFVRGKSNYFPFTPGGLNQVNFEETLDGEIMSSLERAFQQGGIKTIAPGFEHGIEFEIQPGNKLDALLSSSDLIGVASKDDPSPISTSVNSKLSENVISKAEDKLHLPSPQIIKKKAVREKKKWATVIDVNQPMIDFEDKVPMMAKEYPFELDVFQKQAVYHMENNDSVFIAAHTSAGKTVVAEYAVALAQKHMTRAIYTSPIKALSNQKFRDFSQTFGELQVGILTGDIQINTEASCLIMTTEILRSMLYKGADLIRDVEWVIFDEVHYVNDLERGVVWEEVIIMLPDHVNIVLLSATVPNTEEFAEWVGRTKKKNIYVISTPKRPVPLEHNLYAGKDLHVIVPANQGFDADGYAKAKNSLKSKQELTREAQPGDANARPAQGKGPNPAAGAKGANRGRGGSSAVQPGGANARPAQGKGPNPAAGAKGANRGRGGSSAVASRVAHQAMKSTRGGYKQNNARDANLWSHLIGLLKNRQLLPVVIFTFSKKKCEEYASGLTKLDLCNAEEKSQIHVTLKKSLSRLKGTDQELPQILRTHDLLLKGIGVHHGGLLPIVKEIVELLFARGLVKVLFATETFAMGVNMPAKSVVFSGIRKHDGRSFRELLPGEYTQMAGRAGRRGLDTTGTVIIIGEGEVPEEHILKEMLLGPPTKLVSQFRLTYSMILNLLRVEALQVEDMIKRSFSENTNQSLKPQLMEDITKKQNIFKGLPPIDDTAENNAIIAYYDLARMIIQYNSELMPGMAEGKYQYLSPGRIVVLSNGIFREAYAIVTEGPSKANKSSASLLIFTPPGMKSSEFLQDTSHTLPRWPPVPEAITEEFQYDPMPRLVPINRISMICADTVKDVKKAELMGPSGGQRKAKLLEEMIIKTSDGPLHEFDLETKLKSNLELKPVVESRNALIKELGEFPGKYNQNFLLLYRRIHEGYQLERELDDLYTQLSDDNLELLPDYHNRIKVLKEMQFIDQSQTVLLKGRVACEINSADELTLTELILDNIFADFEPEEVVALLSCFVFQEKTENEPVLTERLQHGREIIEHTSERVKGIQNKLRADVLEEFSSEAPKFGLVEVVYEWARGMDFNNIMNLTDVQEGTIVRTITRLDETCREVRDAARIVGNSDLFVKMELCQQLIRRDVIFCASLYL